MKKICRFSKKIANFAQTIFSVIIMAKGFNTEVTCDPLRHYMVDTTKKMKVFERLIDRKKYFTINRARWFGKIWHGTEYEISGRDQLSEYLDTRNLAEGYLVTFSFLKEKVVQEKPEWIEHNGKKIYEAVIDCGKE